MYNKGHEIGDHTQDHKDLRKMSYAQVQQQIAGARATLAACGIPASSIVGFRTPYLSDSPTVRKVLSDAGFRYDSSIGQNGGASRPWPAPISGGMPFDCAVAGNQCSKSESYPSLIEVPLYGYPGGNTMVRGWRGGGAEGRRMAGKLGGHAWPLAQHAHQCSSCPPMQQLPSPSAHHLHAPPSASQAAAGCWLRSSHTPFPALPLCPAVQDPCTNENSGAKKSGCSAYSQMKG